MFKIKVSDFSLNKFMWLRDNLPYFRATLANEYRCIVSNNGLFWKDEYLIFPSEEDYFLFLMRWS